MTANSFGMATLVGTGVGFAVSAVMAVRRRVPAFAYLAGLIGAVLGSIAGYAVGYVVCMVLGSEILVALFSSGAFFFWVVTVVSAIGATLLAIALVDHAARSDEA